MFDIDSCYHLLKSEPNTAHFWSGLGKDGADIAESAARKNGGTTLEMLLKINKDAFIEAGLEYDESEGEFVFSEENAADWAAISEAYAKQASGDVYAVLGEHVRDISYWKTTELPALKKNEDVTSITYIHPITNAGNAKYILGMKIIDVGDIKVAPFEFESIIEIKINKEFNEHSTLYVCGIIRDEKQFSPVTGITQGANIKCEHNGQVYFSGVLQNIRVTCVDAVYRLEAYAISNTILLDTIKHKRSFQDNGQDYQSIVETVIADTGASVTYNADTMTVENIILQYNETDWEFAKRLASHTKDVLIPITDDKPSFHFGVQDDGSAKWEFNDIAAMKDFYALRRYDTISGTEKEDYCNPLGMTDEDVTLYPVQTDTYVCDLGEKFKLNGAGLHVCRVLLSFMKSTLSVVYTLCEKELVSTPKFYNPAITGLILDGTVVEVEHDTLKLKLDDDNERGVEEDTGEKHFFKYATDYSMENHTGWYVMPEEGDTVQLLFPIEDEKYAHAASAVRQDDTERTLDYMVKFWRTSFGREIKMNKDEILITTVDDETYIRIHKDNGEGGNLLGVEVITPNRVLIESGSKINIECEDDMTLITQKNLYIEAVYNIQMVCGGNSMEFDELGEGGVAMSTDKEYRLLVGDNTAIEGQSKLTVKSGKNMTLDSGAKLVEGAEDKIDLSCGNSSITLDSSGIVISSPMICES